MFLLVVVIAIILAAPKFMPYRQPQPAERTVSPGESHPKQRVGGQEMVGMFYYLKNSPPVFRLRRSIFYFITN